MGGAIHPAHGLRAAVMCSALQDMEVTQHAHMLDMRTPVLHQGGAAGGPENNATQLFQMALLIAATQQHVLRIMLSESKWTRHE
jgi:hypothetical protein